MLIDLLSRALEESGAIDGFWQKMDATEDATLAIASSARPFVVSARFARTPQTTLVVVPGEDSAVDFARAVSAYLGREAVLRFPLRSDYPFDERPFSPAQTAQRAEALYALSAGEEKVVVASARALLKSLPPADAEVHHPLCLSTGVDLSEAEGDDRAPGSFEDVARTLEHMGYENTGELEAQGTFAVHGGTIDIFPGNLAYPVRIDFFGDEVDQIRRIVPATGQSISSLKSVRIFPLREYSLENRNVLRARNELAKHAETNPVIRKMYEEVESETAPSRPDLLLPYLYEQTMSVGDYVPADGLVTLVEPRALIDDAMHEYDDIEARAKEARVSTEGLFSTPQTMSFGSASRCSLVSIMRAGGQVDAELPVKRTNVAGDPEKLFGRLRSLVDARNTVVFSVPNFRARQDMKLEAVDRGLPIVELLDVVSETQGESQKAPVKLKRGVVNIVDTEIPLGMIIPAAKLSLIALADTQGSQTVRTSHKVDITEITFPYKPGDYVVHASHGVALFKELVTQDVGGVLRDYLQLEYAEGDRLFVPVEQLDRVTKYVGPEGGSPRLTRLNTSDWSRALSRARKATKKLAFDLVDVYARRAATQGYRYAPDTPWQKEMEDSFPYDETPDQLAAIADIKADMQSARPMDRLVCGDVGFGKTEVALRAAFKATQDDKQVMVLCPTTILAQQHFTTFHDRFEPFGVKVEVLSRFRTPAEQKAALEGFEEGSVQVLVGTHRLLSRDVNPHDLGLVIIDEEQRFGVGHKEQLKNMRESVDVLTLSATPIPRTMQMSLSGVRDMSLILTPPDERRPVKVFVGEWDPDTVADAIRRELARKGQVYYVSNRVRTIEDAVERVRSAVGEARIGVAHGQMTKEQLENVMEDFSAGELDVLIATTIIESGIDNPHTNTLIIEDSHRLGLAQMYQLKGRVGRSSRQAYAYFMFPEEVPLTDDARDRLLAIDELQDLGSGMRIAMRDLEIRGAGSILGAEQSGNMSVVGFDLFAQMLAEAVNATREGRVEKSDLLPPALSDISLNVPGHAYLPEEYVHATDERVLLYRKTASADEVETVDELERAVKERYGDMPQAALNCFAKARVKALANHLGVKTITVVAGKVNIDPIKISRDQMSAWRKYQARYLPKNEKLCLPVRFFAPEGDDDLLVKLAEFFREMAGGSVAE